MYMTIWFILNLPIFPIFRTYLRLRKYEFRGKAKIEKEQKVSLHNVQTRQGEKPDLSRARCYAKNGNQSFKYNLYLINHKLNWFKSFIFEFRTPKIVSAEIFMTVGCVFIVFPTLKLLYSLAVVTFWITTAKTASRCNFFTTASKPLWFFYNGPLLVLPMSAYDNGSISPFHTAVFISTETNPVWVFVHPWYRCSIHKNRFHLNSCFKRPFKNPGFNPLEQFFFQRRCNC